jgi:hypothetical protein
MSDFTFNERVGVPVRAWGGLGVMGLCLVKRIPMVTTLRRMRPGKSAVLAFADA